jgi:hypothetical protein
MQDAHVAVALPSGVVRIAAIDGCTPTPHTPTVAGVNGATYAAGLLAGALLADRPAADVLREVNAHLAGIGGGWLPGHRPQASVVVADVVARDGQLEYSAWAAGDCELWVADGSWRQVAGGACTSDATRAAWADKLVALRERGATFDELYAAECEHFADAALYVNHTPVGRFPQLVVSHASGVADELVAATDGALLDAGRCGDVAGAVADVRDRERAGGSGSRLKASDDLTVVYVAPAT